MDVHTKARRKIRTVFREASMNPFLRPCKKVSVNLSCTSPLSIPRTRTIAFSRGAQLCSSSLPFNHTDLENATNPQDEKKCCT